MDLPSTVDVSAQQISVQIPASDIATAGTATVTVFNPPGTNGGSSSSVSFPMVTGGTNPLSIAVDPTGRFAYVANQGCFGSFPGSVSMYQIGPTGTLSSLGTIPAGSAPISITVDPLGKFAYVANTDSKDVSTYIIDPSTGVLTALGKTTVGAAAWSISIDPSGRFAYLANSLGNDVLMYAIDPNTGALTSIGSTVPETGPLGTPWAGPISVTVDPLGRVAYVSIQGDGGDMTNGSVSVYTINPNTGVLTFTGRADGSCGASVSLCGPDAVAIDRSGKFAIAVGAYGGVSLYTINATTGILTSIDTANTGHSRAVALDPTGKYAYVVNFDSNDVSTYAIDVSGGTLTPTGTIPAGSNPSAIAIAPSGEFAYVTNYGSNDVSIYSIDAVTGALTLIASIGT
jgi:YVTN family beta-propeller protein